MTKSKNVKFDTEIKTVSELEFVLSQLTHVDTSFDIFHKKSIKKEETMGNHIHIQYIYIWVFTVNGQ